MVGQRASAGSGALGSRIESMVAPYVELRDFSGSILVADRGEVLFSAGFGLADAELGVPNQPTTRFLIGSVSKQFTAAALLLLEADGRLSLKDPISNFVAGFSQGDEITIHHVLTHTSGIPDIFALESYSRLRHEDPRVADVVEMVRARPLDFEPGTRYSYSNSGYVVLAHILEQVSGVEYAEFLRQRIFGPLEMDDSGALAGRGIVPGLATGYDPLGQTGLRRAIQVAPALYTGPGSVFSTTGDLLLWDRALRADTVLPDSSRTKMMTDYGNSYGYGVSVFERFGGMVVEHDGRLPGYACDFARYPDREAVVIILGNIQSAMRDRLRDDIAAILHGEDPVERIVRQPPKVAAERSRLEKVEGFYDFAPNFFVAVRSADDRLFLRANQGEESEFFPVARDRFFSRALYAGAAFEFDENGSPIAMDYSREGRVFRGERRD
ncbi:MAG: hypothetical protein DHS20C21_07360 [Gemmatimonadota bacterium]|nr:MAG: hypothetical protein DHS20C21_07360 [Gemmatimonadota bacterium]